MDGANADSDHSMTWEDFFGSTSDLTPTLIGIYDSLLKPAKAQKQELSRFDFTPKDARNNPPLDVTETSRVMIEETKDVAKDIEIIAEADIPRSPPKDPSKIAGSVKLPMVNKSSLYSLRTKVESDTNGANDNVSCLTSSDSTISLNKTNVKTFKFQSKVSDTSTFDNLSPNVKRMISSASETTANQLKFQKKTSASAGRASIRGHKSNIPLVGATSKITQSGVEILPSVDIYDQPHGPKVPNKTKIEEQRVPLRDSSSKTPQLKPEFKLDVQETYDVPTNNRPAIYDVPVNKTAFESLSLPFIDQSIELSITSDDREFDVKVASKDNSPEKALPTQEASPTKTPTVSGTNSLNRKDFGSSPVKQLSKTDPYPEAIGSTGNLKSIAIPEKEVPRLNPPSVEVSRPLSMSSIASSSSTSSSGAQNKGGVNSAYLASIESLDDHSDADMISANGSNNFVNNAGVKGVSEDRDNMPRDQNEEVSGLSQLERVCAEIIHTENVYVRDLQQVVEGYLHIWRKESTFSVEELSELFNNIEDIYSFNRSLCEELNTCRLDATCIARCFVNNTSGFSVYTRYCTGYPATMERLAALASTAESARQFRERQLALGHPLPLASYLLKPVQRILKYHLLLQVVSPSPIPQDFFTHREKLLDMQNVVKQCASRETEFALLKMTGIAQHIDDMKRRHEHAVRVQEIQSLLYGWNGPDLTTYGELCAEGTFRVFGAKAMRHAFLFDKMLLVTKNREDGILAYKSHIMCNNMMLVESIAGAPLSFHVIPWDAPRAQLTLRARSPRHKREWTLLLKRVILENYNAVIPSHARQLVMELGQNKTDDDMLAEKSHNLITQASMRKQLSAPEYLEKRKLERERRKSFENGIRGRLKKSNRKNTVPNSRHDHQEDCDCLQFSTEKGIDYTCDNCYIDLCSDCEVELSSKTKPRNDKCTCRNDDNNELDPEKCPECDRSLHYIDSGSAEHLERKPSICKCSDFKSSQESVGKEFPNSLNKTRGYHSSDNIVGYTDSKSKENIADATICSMTSVRVLPKTCLKCTKIKENIPVTDSTSTLISRKSRSNDTEKNKQDTLRSKSRDDPQRSKLSKIGTWRRKSEPGLQQNNVFIGKRQDTETERAEPKGNEKIEFECRNCGSNKISKKSKSNEVVIISDPELENRKRGISAGVKSNVEIKMYNTKNIPKKISKLKKNRTKGFRLGSDTTAKFYADFPTDISTENILHISESNDSLNIENTTKVDQQKLTVPGTVSKDEDIDEETYKKLIEKTDSFKKNELEKVKYLNQQKVINEGSEAEIDKCVERSEILDIEDCDVSEQPLEQIISQLLLQNREFQKLLKKQQQRHSAQRRHQRLLKSHSNPEQEAPPKSDVDKMRPKYVRSTSENLDAPVEEIKKLPTLSPPNEVLNETDDDHIYETLRVETKADENLHTLNSKSKSIQHNTRINRPVRLPSPPNLLKNKLETKPRISTHESDYVYLSFDKLNKVQDEINAIYDVPVKSPEKVDNVTKPQDYYVIIEKKDPIITVTEQEVEDIYDSIIEVCRRKKEITVTGPGEYLPMGLDKKNPNTPEIWLSRQKEHFNVSHDRKSGSLPRSFQIVTNNPEDANVSSFKCKPNTNSKTYLNRDGKVVSTDRPFTIASDKSEISYDDVENYMSEGDVLKFNKTTKSNDSDYLQDISQSTLELEEEIDRCYRVNFEKMNLDSNKNESLAVSQPNLNTSTTSSCEVLPAEKSTEIETKDIEIVHPEHKIYKPTSNMLSLKNVLSRFKTRNPNKSDDNNEINANEQSSPDSAKSDLKSPTNEKKPALNPRSYSKNLLQRFRNIIGDEQPDDNENRPFATLKTKKAIGEAQNKQLKSEIKVVVTSTDVSSTSTSVSTGNNDILSKSVCETTTLTESQNEKNNPDNIFYSCDNISQKSEIVRPGYEKSVSLITTRSSSIASSTASPIRSNNSSFQSLNKLPIYMQGSKHMGAKIAQSDYVDPSSLMHENSSKNINILINKNAVRPDSLFSNLSFVTTSSDGVHHETPPKTSFAPSEDKSSNNAKSSDSCAPINSDESCYEKSFEKIEQVTDEDIFRDSAVYSDQEDIETDSAIKTKGKSVSRIESIKRSFKTHNMSIATSVTEKTSFHSRVTFTTKDIQQKEKVTTNTERKSLGNEKTKTKIAPPVPVKPKLSHSPSPTNLSTRTTNIPNYNLKKTQEHAFSNESIDTKTIKRNTTMKQTYLRSESTPTEDKKNQRINVQKNKETHSKLIGDATKIDAGDNNAESKNSNTATTSKLKSPASSIQIKRLSFERASLDSATRKIKVTNATDNKRQSMDNQNPTSKSVLERRLEIESMSKSQTTKTNATSIKKPSQIAKPKSISTKMATFERSVSESEPKDVISTSIDKPNISSNENSIIEEPKDDEPRGSWVKTVVNKFQ